MNNRPPMEWYIFEMPVAAVLAYLERSGRPLPDGPEAESKANKWHLALRRGLRQPLHLNVGIPGVEEPGDPVEENLCALHAALLLGHPTLRVILSGEWQVAVEAGLITPAQLARHEQALAEFLAAEEG